MGEVWRATDRTLGRTVAAKVLKSEYTGDRNFLERFRNEARHTAGLAHQNIASVYDYGETRDDEGRDLAFLVMEYVEGEPLVAVLDREVTLSPQRTLDVLAQAGEGLSAAHQAGVVHRDIKPGNLMVRPDGVVKLTDFGIAWARDAAPLTRTGMVVGTAQYLSPEQAQGFQVTAASDVYSLGILGYECLAGTAPSTASRRSPSRSRRSTGPRRRCPPRCPPPCARWWRRPCPRTRRPASPTAASSPPLRAGSPPAVRARDRGDHRLHPRGRRRRHPGDRRGRCRRRGRRPPSAPRRHRARCRPCRARRSTTTPGTTRTTTAGVGPPGHGWPRPPWCCSCSARCWPSRCWATTTRPAPPARPPPRRPPPRRRRPAPRPPHVGGTTAEETTEGGEAARPRRRRRPPRAPPPATTDRRPDDDPNHDDAESSSSPSSSLVVLLVPRPPTHDPSVAPDAATTP